MENISTRALHTSKTWDTPKFFRFCVCLEC